jgi:Putative  PD-(D/E)XK family member, (DUF4420)
LDQPAPSLSQPLLNLVDVFRELVTPASADSGLRFIALPVPGYEQHRLGKDAAGAPALLVAAGGIPRYGWPAPVVLEHLTVQHDVECRVSRPGGPVEDGHFTVIRCRTPDPTLHAYFLQVAAAVVALLGAAPSQADVTGAIDRLVELFRAMTLPARKSVQGLWAELFLMARLRHPATLVQAWHVLPEDRYDLSAGAQRIEVKSAAGRIRQHYFSLDQVLPIPGTEVLIASVLVERAGSGPSVIDLAQEIRRRLGNTPELLLHLDRVMSLTLGEAYRYASEDYFDRELAEHSLAFFDPDAIPKVSPTLPPGVSDVRFRADLTAASPIDIDEYRSRQGLFAAALRR